MTPPSGRFSRQEISGASVSDVLTSLASSASGLSTEQAADRRAEVGPNSMRTHGVSVVGVLGRQLNNAVLGLLAATAVVSFFLGDSTQAIIIGVILAISIGLGFVNEYRAERATAALHSRIRHTATVLRDNRMTKIDVIDLVPGDVIRLELGELVPADVRLLEVNGLECNESILTGESTATEKTAAAPAGTDLAGASNIAFMGTVVSAGDATAVVYATGADAEFGRIAAGLGEREPETEFQVGLRRFSYLLLRVAMILTVAIIIINLMLDRPLVESALFGLAIAVGITPQLLPAVVSTSLAAGSRRLARRRVLVKRLVCIEDLGDIDIIVTDKTGTLTENRIELIDTVDPEGRLSESVLRLGMLATEIDPSVGGTCANQLDAALWADRGPVTDARRIALLPFDHTRRATTALIEDAAGRHLVCKGAPEQIIATCDRVPAAAERTLAALFAEGRRVVAVATRPAPELSSVSAADETGLELCGFLVFADPPKAAARESLRQLAALGIEVKVATGDNPAVAEKVCADLGLPIKGVVIGADLEGMAPDQLDVLTADSTIFARVSPEQKSRVISSLRRRGRSVGFLGDGVNDALALHSADVGISVDSATDVAKDAADVVMLDKDLGVLATGVAEGRRIFANTIKYVLMGTSSNFGNMFSAAAASAVLTFLPMLPSQILLNNLLYDTSQLAIPTDRVDDEQLHAPSHWNIGFIRRFMLTFGPISSLFDFLTFGLLLGVLHAGPIEFRTGWFVESLATQTLIIFAVRTRRVPFFRSRSSASLILATAAVIAAGVALTVSPLSGQLGFTPLPWQFFAALAGMTVAYLILVEAAKKAFYAEPELAAAPPVRTRGHVHRVHRRAARFNSPVRARP
ncbi:magnesium-translocating P-type ATPase [Mycolicibacterium confluentis]|uniref:Magnesium-transporting ATPase, P-type 1 n=1 Tax=Mycolicibacterium confluentis TaxID=28047 RepID=A0A7I7XVR8_9MYCO|nr:magnesium-translocating P-type ATPase [Mycolicibacterium confluentis]MCV7321597.1 magnesium-translocating P-type ATPase [Mycolicibacterium confluentis]ORV26698.1 magnesium-transporting ATPase [Mycolicibacterium confluentis]BBZ33405.1 magnesium-translocating P-type ATPase [Mycolicibacterium confluentis]